MKELTNIQRATQYLNKIFKACNEKYFDNEIEMPVITIQSSIGAFGHVSVSKVWNTNGVARHELNLGAEYLQRDCTELVSTILHEMCHLYAIQHNIKDTSNRGVYHNASYRKIATDIAHLNVDRHDKYGWTITTPTEDTINFCIEYQLEDIKINRGGAYQVGTATPTVTPTKPTKTRKPSSTRKYQCPCCGNSFRATKSINVMCMDCNEQFVVVD